MNINKQHLVSNNNISRPISKPEGAVTIPQAKVEAFFQG
jgi:hypothetical protein